MILYEVFPNKTLKIRENENTYITENLISSVHIKLPSTFGDYPVKELTAELRFYFPEGDYMAYEVDTQQAHPEVPITNDITEKPQTLSVMLFFYKGGNVIGKTNTIEKVIHDAPLKGEPLTPRAEFDEVIAEQRETIAEQAETITEQAGTISSQGEQITELSGEVTELTTENTRLENLTETQRQTIQNMIDNPPQPRLYTPPDPIEPSGETRVVTAPSGYDGLGSVTFLGTDYMNVDLQKWLSRESEEPFEMIFNSNIGDYLCYAQIRMRKAIINCASVGSSSFGNCSGLEEVIFSNNTGRIGRDVFRGCSALYEINLPSSVLSVGPCAFSESGITKITLPSNFPRLDYEMLRDVPNLKYINLPKSLQSIGTRNFYFCSQLEFVTIEQGFNCNDLNLSSSTRYSADTILSWFNALADRTGETAYTLTIGSTNLNKMTAEQKAIATNKNWNLA